ncbi:tRNA (adenosine(37)-N6)-threonylcarbamoyltransferase complex ATPase subunit type 1 TsaE [Clostridiisalibacter paucivorans]|uniref:tRNA (adenosine(37)-N6)-threonylcarbamoyltransferase complex ATPase subunit type 1 TsaE n=1 Tax=Clostridiisalibacter paucivorans TaxID=408753 RepID=UPI00047AC748|nr:tRNA (adenosine(37)-N6)-threonylcarbamoyltransferase complex ATPase subunit type 1 TsaE [Clostridiisalibacter paucivorans]
MINIISDSVDKTENLGYELGKSLSRGDVVCLMGDLGAGKTTITQSICRGLEVDDYVTSPTFTIVNEYIGRWDVYHFDVYRIEDEEEMYDIGYDEYIYGDGVSIIEWADKIRDILPKERIEINIERISDNKRKIIINPIGEKYEKMIENILNNN